MEVTNRGHPAHVSWSTLAREFDYGVHCVMSEFYFQQVLVNVRSWSGQKGQIFNIISVNKNVPDAVRAKRSKKFDGVIFFFSWVKPGTCSNMYKNIISLVCCDPYKTKRNAVKVSNL